MQLVLLKLAGGLKLVALSQANLFYKVVARIKQRRELCKLLRIPI